MNTFPIPTFHHTVRAHFHTNRVENLALSWDLDAKVSLIGGQRFFQCDRLGDPAHRPSLVHVQSEVAGVTRNQGIANPKAVDPTGDRLTFHLQSGQRAVMRDYLLTSWVFVIIRIWKEKYDPPK